MIEMKMTKVKEKGKAFWEKNKFTFGVIAGAATFCVLEIARKEIFEKPTGAFKISIGPTDKNNSGDFYIDIQRFNRFHRPIGESVGIQDKEENRDFYVNSIDTAIASKHKLMKKD